MKIKTIAILGAAITGVSLAGEKSTIPSAPVTDEIARSWCDAFDTLGGPLYKNPNNGIIQELDVFGRVQWQYAYVDGDDVNGDSYHDSFEEWRRVRVGAQVKFLNYFTLKGNINIVGDSRPSGGDSEFDYQSFDELKLTTDIGKMFGTAGFDSLKLITGRIKFDFSQEAHMSSKKIKTVERSALSNKVYPGPRGTGVLIDAEKGAYSYTVGVFGDADEETLAGFDNGLVYYASVGFEASETASYLFDATYNDNDRAPGSVENFLGYDWALSVAGIYDYGKFEFMWNAIYGENNGTGDRDGAFYGLVLMPSYWLIEDKLEAVARYTYQGSEEDEGVRLNSRYVRRAESRDVADVNSGRGDEHHALYVGLNWYLCGHNLKLMTGVEYDKLEAPGTPEGDADSFTYWMAARTYF